MAGRRRLLIVSNRGPVSYSRDESGDRIARRGAGGLVTALAPLVSRHDVTWVAGAMTAEERAIAAAGAVEEQAADGSRYRLRLVPVDPGAYRLFYDVVANPVLWFVQHGLWDLIEDPGAELSGPWHDGYVHVNDAFADVVSDELAHVPDAAVMFQDYHLYTAPRVVRQRHPDAAISHFVHIPWVGPERWSVLSAGIVEAIHDGLHACDVVGFHAARWRDAFEASSAVYADAADTVIDVNPISVDPSEFDALAAGEAVLERAEHLLSPRPPQLILRVDRTDPAKNAIRGFEAFSLMLERRPDLHAQVGMLALLHPSRLSIPEYATYAEALQATATLVNERFGRPGWTPITLDLRDDFLLSVAAYREYDVLLVNSVKDGLNLVAKEAPLVNARDGVLALSREAGAFDELGEWVVPLDPLDVHQQSIALEQALEVPPEERRDWQEAIRAHVRAHDLDAWATQQLSVLDRASTMRS